MTPKKVIIIGPAHPLRGGLASYNHLLAQRLEEQGHSVKIITFKLQYPLLWFPGKTQYSSEPAPEGVNIDIKMNSIWPLNWLKVGWQLKNEDADLIIFRYWLSFMAPCFGTIARLARLNKKTRIVAITDNVIPHEPHWFDKPLTKYFLKACHGFTCMSKAVKEDLRKYKVKQPITYNAHPMYENFGPVISQSEAELDLDLNPMAKHLLFFGFIRKYKGLDILLKAFADPRIAKMQLDLIIAGEYYEDAEPYEKLIEELGIADRVQQRTSFIPNAEVGKYFCAADLVVQPYRDATQSGVTQIAYYYNKPMIVTNVGGLPELVEHGQQGYVCEVDPTSIADSIVDFFQNTKSQEMVNSIKERKKEFTWPSMIDKLFLAAQIND